MNMLKTKQVGKVQICELFGSITVRKEMGFHMVDNIFWNLYSAENFHGFSRHLKSISRKSAVLTNRRLRPMIQANAPSQVKVFENLIDVAWFFNRELAESGEGKNEERRHHPRLKTVLPLRFLWDEKGCRLEFFAVVTNLSLGGLCAQFIEFASETKLKNEWDPYDLKMVHLWLYFDPTTVLELRGKIIHYDAETGAFGAEFYGMPEEQKQILKGRLYPAKESEKEVLIDPKDREVSFEKSEEERL